MTATGAGHGSGELRAPAVSDPPTSQVLSARQFWSIFVAAWLAYGGLLSVAFVLEGRGPLYTLGAVAGNLFPLLAPTLYLAVDRRRFLRPRATLARFVGHKVVGAILYALTVAVLGSVIVSQLPERPTTELGSEPGAIFAVLMVTGLFFYGLVLGFLLWVDALERLAETRSLAEREAVLRAQAEAKALRAQFNPHFVFNTLHSLMLLVRRDPDTAERAIEDVAALIRYASTLQRQEVDQVPLGKELAFARRYLALEKLRLAERLEVVWDVDDDLDDVLVPAFSLQTLLENAIKHGIAPKPEGGAIRIQVGAHGGAVAMSVHDDGLGTDPSSVGANGGSGLHLLAQRLATVYDGDARLEWSTAPGDGFLATLRLPVRRARADAGAPA